MNNSYYKPCSKCNNDECVFRGSADTNELCEDFTEWIPVSEKLPKDGTWNLFTDGKQISVERFKFDAVNHFFPDGRWFSFDEAVAWMPLPQPYKVESEDKE